MRTGIFTDGVTPAETDTVESQGGTTMQDAIPAREYSADERAQRARGAGIALLSLLAIGAAAIATVLLFVFLR